MTKRILVLALSLGLLLARPASAQESGGPTDDSGEQMSLEEISRMLDNPLGNLWLVFMENDVARFRGKPADGWKTLNILTIQPILPVPLTEDWNLVTRPIIPIVSAPKFEAPNFGDCPGNCNSRPSDARLSSDRETDLADVVVWSMLSPSEPPKLPDGSSLVWGVGPSFRFPTATEDQFGSEKWSVGPSNIILRLPPPEGRWTLGLFHHHHFSFAGDSDRSSVRSSQFQPIYWYKLTDDGAWSIGGFPMITVNWKAGSGDKLTLPIELAISHTLFLGPMPVRLVFGANYSVVRPDDYGQRYMFKFALVPVIPRLVKEPIFSRFGGG
jgi:hypothetical protein